ncbi:MAG: helix-turn-helix transcriptional regulator [Alcanivoracaceae bacterium]|nr:helix-turn-helix transcriptional regulator [Alcanivoracaceae bacterium]
MNDKYEKNNAIIISIGKRIESLRLQKHIKQVELAKTSTVSISTIRRMEAGKIFSMEALIKVLHSLDQLQDLQALITIPSLSPVEIAKQDIKADTRSGRVRST